jgi:malate:Na+ symporter
MSDLVPAASELANVSAAASNSGGAEPWWPRGWWKIMDTRIGIIPIPVFVILFARLVGFTYTGDIKGEISMMIAVLVIGGFTCAEIGKRIPILRNIGSAAIFATFIPSALAYYKLIPLRSRNRSSSSPSIPTSSTSSLPASSSAASLGWIAMFW